MCQQIIVDFVAQIGYYSLGHITVAIDNIFPCFAAVVMHLCIVVIAVGIDLLRKGLGRLGSRNRFSRCCLKP